MSQWFNKAKGIFDKELSRIMTEQYTSQDLTKQEGTLDGCHIKWFHRNYNQNPCRENPFGAFSDKISVKKQGDIAHVEGYIQTRSFYSSAPDRFEQTALLQTDSKMSCGHDLSKAVHLHDEVICTQCTREREVSRWVPSLETLQWIDRCQQREVGTKTQHKNRLSDEDRARVSAAWSAELRAKVAASEAERKSREVSVVLEYDVEDDPWCTWRPR